jgi:uncharacterized membrane protein
MADFDNRTQLALPDSHLITLTHVVYALHAFSAITGLTTTAFVVTAFLTGWPSIIAVIINYARRKEVRGTFLESHFSWQLRTFWWAVLWLVIAGLLFVTLIGIPVAWLIAVCLGAWVLYRIIRGWLALMSHKPLPR